MGATVTRAASAAAVARPVFRNLLDITLSPVIGLADEETMPGRT